jgi:pimeloyl-ACP methyl ester carboxylesterase
MTEVDVRGTSVRVRRAGAGEPLLLLRGADASDIWLPFMDRLAASHDVIVPEHPGFGGRALPPWLDRVADLAMFYLDFIGQLGLSRVHLVGTSLGGWIAADLAHRNTSRLATLTLAAASGLRVEGASGIDQFMMSEEQALRAGFHDAAAADAAVARMLTAENEDVRLANAIAIARVAWSPRLHDPHLANWLHRIDVPTLIVWGQQDRIVPPEHARAYAEAIAQARLSLIEGCGHWIALERPEDLAARVLAHTVAQR